jgi:peptidyl-prolyl cis-trans isomerase SurA
MKKHFVSAAVVAAAITAFAATSGSDPVLMTVNGRDVHVSEFNYLYNKNNSQQIQPQTLDEYVKMFVDYKLKVADAENAGIDTTQAFRSEYNQFESELSRPYLRDASVEDSILHDAYSHLLEDVDVSHIMLQFGRTPKANEEVIQRLDSIRTAIVSGKITFEEAAEKYSIDNGSKNNGGHMGVVTPGRYPWPFEKAAYAAKVGDVTEVVNSGVGLHLIRVNKRSKSEGEVLVQHILRLTRNLSDEQAAAEKVRIDSIYNAVKAGGDFSDLATRLSQDPGSAKRGGRLDWFGHGMMVPQFDSVAYALADGETSAPFATAYGYHIIHKLDHRGVASFESKRADLLKMIANDERGMQPDLAKLKQLKSQYNAKLFTENLDEIQNMIAAAASGYDSTVIANLSVDDTPIFSVNGKTTAIEEVMPKVAPARSSDAVAARHLIESAANKMMDEKVLAQARQELIDNNEDYRNLINEYRDGILLFEIAKQNVWDRASKDTEGLEKYFNANRKKYAWDSSKFKGYVIFTTSDSLLNEAKAYAESLPKADQAEFTKQMRDKFGRDIKVERVIAAKGDNAITDYLAFGADKPAADKATGRWAYYFAFDGQIIDAPQEAADVKGAVVTDYQNELEQQWLKTLRKKYPVKIDKKVLSTLK